MRPQRARVFLANRPQTAREKHLGLVHYLRKKNPELVALGKTVSVKPVSTETGFTMLHETGFTASETGFVQHCETGFVQS